MTIGKFTDRLRGFGESLLKLRIDQLHDHNMDGYISALLVDVNKQKSQGELGESSSVSGS